MRVSVSITLFPIFKRTDEEISRTSGKTNAPVFQCNMNIQYITMNLINQRLYYK